MCGIVGYIGTKRTATQFVLSGLQTLEYRGYDSAGLTTIINNKAVSLKEVGRVKGLRQAVEKVIDQDTNIAIGHTRWATHGAPTVENAHPQSNSAETIFVAHNGIIENYQALRALLKEQGYSFVSQTDTEVIPQLIDYYLRTHDTFLAAFKAAIKDLQGAYSIAALSVSEPDKLFVARLSSPLVIGVGQGEHYVASDPAALMDKTKEVMYLDDYEIAVISADGFTIHDIKKSAQVQRGTEMLDFEAEKFSLGDYPNFMLKEINEAPTTIKTATSGRIHPDGTVKLGGLESVSEQLRYIDRIVIVACGTASYAALLGEYLIEEIAGIPVEVQVASEFKYRNEPFSRSTALVVISQSGETADTIAALKKVESYGVLRLGVVNAVGSTIARMTDAGVYCHAGSEQSVASTKAFIAQVTVLTEIALYLSQGKSPLHKTVVKELLALPEKAQQVLAKASNVESLAKKYAGFKNFMYIGRKYGYPCALEGALKLKELTYVHAEGCAAGELKHGPIAMIDEQFPTFAIACDGPLLDKTMSNIEEIKARKGPVLAIATTGNVQISKLVDDVLYIPDCIEQLQPLLTAIILQLFAYYVAVEKGCNVDRPRNLAKSVTVE